MSDQFPNDANGDALRRLRNDGDKLTEARDVDFNVLFPNQSTAEAFAEQFREEGYVVEVTECDSMLELSWNARVVKNLVPTYNGILSFEDELQTAATPLGGRNDGWGCFALPDVN